MVESRRCFVVGVGMTPFLRPGKHDRDYPDLAKEAAERALADAQIDFKDVEMAAVGYVYGDSTCGQRAVYEVGMTGIPIYNVNNNCATGSSALFMARQFVSSGLHECVMALGFEKMERGSLGSKFTDRTNPMDKHMMKMMDLYEFAPAPPAAQIFGNGFRDHAKKYGTSPETLAKIAWKNHKNSNLNPYSQFRDIYSLEQIKNSPMVHEPLTKLQCCPTSDGAACAIVCSEEYVKKHGLEGQAIEIVGMSMKTDFAGVFEEKATMIDVVGAPMTQAAAKEAYTQAGIQAKDIDVLELHDCFSANEMITYEALGLCPEGGAEQFVKNGDNDYGGQVVVNPSGGLISKGHPLGTGLAQCAEMVWQLRNEAGVRQVQNAKVALTHNLGLGGAVVVTVYKKPFEGKPKRKESGAFNFQPMPEKQTAKL